MKKGLLLLVASLVSFASINSVAAEETTSDTITNRSGVVIPIEKYNALKSIYSDNFMNYMTQEEYNIIKDKDLSKVVIKETTDANLNSSTGTRATEHTTSSKSLRIINNGGFVTMSLTWYKVPTIKKWDVMAFRKNSSVSMSNYYSFRQYYMANNELQLSSEKYGQNFDNGVGATFKVQNGTDHQMELSMDFTGSGRVYGSYQHASSSKATLADGMDYTLSGSGFGGVILFNPKIEGKYDGMGGVYLTL